jgi:Big-like domain-containing protein
VGRGSVVAGEAGSTKRCAIGATAAVVLGLGLTACGGDPPQIVDYAPQRNTVDVSTAEPIRITFDHDVDQSSVAARLHLAPSTIGSVRWISGRQLVYDHVTLLTSTNYEVILEPGYRDPAGNTYTLRHHWSFVTEGPPFLAGSAPANRDTGVDPSAYLSLDFSRAMDPAHLRAAISIYPAVPFDVKLDPADSRRAIIAPSQLLEAHTAYQVGVNVGVTDIDGNQLARQGAFAFTTGAVQPLRHWIAFATDSSDGTSAGLWIVNDEFGFPRQLFDASAVHSFSWSPQGDSLLIQGQDERWVQYTPGGSAAPLTFKATWAAALASGMGYVYIDDSGVLHRQGASGVDDVIATDVAEAAVAPNGLRVAFIHRISNANEVWGYDVGLRATYLLVLDSAPVSSASWDPAGNRIAYLRHDQSTTTLRVRSLTGAASTSSITNGTIGRPTWLPDSTHIVFAATVITPTQTLQKAFVVNVASPPSTLSAAAAIPSDPSIEVASPVSSPDGHQIAFLSGDQVWLMNSDGTRPTALTKEDPSFPYSCRAPAWTRS